MWPTVDVWVESEVALEAAGTPHTDAFFCVVVVGGVDSVGRTCEEVVVILVPATTDAAVRVAVVVV